MPGEFTSGLSASSSAMPGTPGGMPTTTGGGGMPFGGMGGNAGGAGGGQQIPLPGFLADTALGKFLNSNPFFAAGFGLGALGGMAGFFKTGGGHAVHALKRRCLISLEVPSKDPSYKWVMQWLVTRRSIGNQNWHHRGVETNYAKDAGGRVDCRFDFVPSPGKHWMQLGWMQFVQVDRQRDAKTIDLQTGAPWETITLTTLAYPNGPGLFQQILDDAKELAMQKEEGKTIVYKVRGHEWIQFGDPKEIRPFNSVVLPGELSKEIASDVRDFLDGKDWYFDRGIPYRRGYLFHGPPGCGKSSYVMALAGLLQYNICVLNLGDPTMTDDRLQHLLATCPANTLVLLEDIDQACSLDEDMGASSGGGDDGSAKTGLESSTNPYLGLSRVTFSGLLNALDGVVATEERLIFMTTNHLHRLPSVLVRPGRVDLKCYVGYATREQCYQLFKRFYPNAHERLATAFCNEWAIEDGLDISMAELQGFLMFFKNRPEECIDKVKEFVMANPHLAAKWKSKVPDWNSEQMPDLTPIDRMPHMMEDVPEDAEYEEILQKQREAVENMEEGGKMATSHSGAGTVDQGSGGSSADSGSSSSGGSATMRG